MVNCNCFDVFTLFISRYVPLNAENVYLATEQQLLVQLIVIESMGHDLVKIKSKFRDAMLYSSLKFDSIIVKDFLIQKRLLRNA